MPLYSASIATRTGGFAGIPNGNHAERAVDAQQDLNPRSRGFELKTLPFSKRMLIDRSPRQVASAGLTNYGTLARRRVVLRRHFSDKRTASEELWVAWLKYLHGLRGGE